ncbi:radical SAM protein [Streptomyces hoynatensis]|uniref:Radical SAM protein n=2 Tax=Streptomyces hoynatensis TaxID=1141874 RepID=A0A3A9ZGG4_9ACTN|nr:radical SAM protein [Streptomyces hoynatensis]
MGRNGGKFGGSADFGDGGNVGDGESGGDGGNAESGESRGDGESGGNGESRGDGGSGGKGGDPVVRVSGTYFPVTTLGPGRRLGIWFQGCPLACPGCMSRHTWDPEGGRRTTVSRLLGAWRRALAAGAAGLTVSGGEPLAQPEALERLLSGAAAIGAELAPERRPDILLYTGHTEAELGRRPPWLRAVGHADALITGRYRAAAPTPLVWRGSANQRLLPRTALGRERYGPHLARPAEGPRLQVAESPGGAGVLLYGVPAPGELQELAELLARSGTRLHHRSWDQPG